nr:unnamed protein product [Callosobruchus chinensis]
MDCLHPSAGGGPATAPHHATVPGTAPFHYLISEQAKSLAALQELQHEVGALLEFRDLVMETFPNLRTKLLGDDGSREDIGGEHRRGSGPDPGQGHHSSNIPVSIRTGEWTPGIRVRKKISSNSKDENRSSKKSDAVQDSGFSTEASSKETHSASSTAPAPSSAPGVAETDEVEDELFHLLDIIHRKGTRLKDEAEALQGQLRCSAYSIGPAHHSADGPMGATDAVTAFERHLFRPASAEDVRLLRRERDMLLDRLAEAEAEAVAGRARAARLREDLDSLMAAKVDLEEQLRAVVTQRGEVNSRIHDLHLQFVTKGGGAITSTPAGSAPSSPDGPSATAPPRYPTVDVTGHAPGHQRRRQGGGASELDAALGDVVPRSRSVDSRKVAAILREKDWLGLQRHLLASTVRNQVLQEKLDSAVNLELSLRDKLNKYREENEDLKFQLEDKNIELEGTRARLRLLEELHQPSSKTITSPDIIPVSESSTTDHPILSRSEITTASMKAMSPLPLMDQHSSSTESAHDHAEKERKRKPSKIPLKSYTAPKPPGGKKTTGKHSPSNGGGPRSRSGDRPHSAQSWRHSRGGPAHADTSTSLPKSRNGSLGPVRDSLSGKLRSTDSLSRAAQAQAAATPTTTAAEKVRSKTASSIWNFFRRD